MVDGRERISTEARREYARPPVLTARALVARNTADEQESVVPYATTAGGAPQSEA